MSSQAYADLIWESQRDYEPGMPEAEQQQRRALADHTHDVLMVLSGLGYVHMRTRPSRYALALLCTGLESFLAYTTCEHCREYQLQHAR